MAASLHPRKQDRLSTSLPEVAVRFTLMGGIKSYRTITADDSHAEGLCEERLGDLSFEVRIDQIWQLDY
jgi:hypothetical protein